jgi:hypothetical protein
LCCCARTCKGDRDGDRVTGTGDRDGWQRWVTWVAEMGDRDRDG